MSNPERGEVSVMVGTERFTFRPTFNSLCELEDLTNKSLDVLMREVEQGRVSGIRSVVWCLLQHYHADQFKTLKDAGAWIERADDAGVNVREAMLRVFGLNMAADGEDQIPANPPNAQAGTGEPASSVLVGSV